MFSAEVYGARRKRLAEFVKSGVMLFLGNEESPRNYQDNVYPFRQDSSFLYFWGLSRPSLAAVIDIDEGVEALFGDDLTSEEMIWFGQHVSFREAAAEIGIQHIYPFDHLESVIKKSFRRKDPCIFYRSTRLATALRFRKC